MKATGYYRIWIVTDDGSHDGWRIMNGEDVLYSNLSMLKCLNQASDIIESGLWRMADHEPWEVIIF